MGWPASASGSRSEPEAVSLDFPTLWAAAARWDSFLHPDMDKVGLWQGIYDRALIPEWAVAGFQASPVRHLLVIAEDWCLDAASTVPVMARLAEAVPHLELRILARDTWPGVMDRYLTEGTRSIPVVILLDAEFRELGHWGPRPAALQAWVMEHRKTMPSPQRHAYTRQWYARDRGETTLRELLEVPGARQ